MNSHPPRLTAPLAILLVAVLAPAMPLADEPATDKPDAEPPVAAEPLAVPATGPSFRGKLAAALDEPEWALRFDGADGQREIAVADLALWGGFVEPKRGSQVVLAGGGILVVDALHIDDDRLVGSSGLLETLDLPLRLVAGILFEPATDRRRGDRLLARVRSLAGQTDRVILNNGDELTGAVSALDETTLRLQSESCF